MMLRPVPASLSAVVLAAGLAGAVLAQPAAQSSRQPAPASASPVGGTVGGTVGGSVGDSVGIGIDPMLDPRLRMARSPFPKTPTERLDLPIDKATGEVSTTGRIILKLRDELGARSTRSAPSDRVFSTIGANLGSFDAVLARFGGTVQQWITHRDDLALREVELRAEVRSGRGQPDLASYLVVNVAPAVLLEAGRAFNDLEIVEFVEFERPLVTFQNESCNAQNENICNAPGTTCGPGFFLCNPDPGCFATPPDCRAGCADVDCCTTVAGLLPYCNDPEQPNGWDLICAALANLVCDQTIYDAGGSLPPAERYDPCFTDGTGAPNPTFAFIAPALSGGCFEARDTRGCNQPACCFAVCSIDPTCCNIAWDAGCVTLAGSTLLDNACSGAVVVGPTPDFKSDVIANPLFGTPGEPPFLATNYQAYLVSWPALSDFTFAPPDPAIVFPAATGFRGGGFDLPGLRALQTQFANIYQDGIEPLLNGRTVKVGIIEFSAFVNHEDFVLDASGQPLKQPKVIPEPGQTIILINGGANDPEHGTACLGINVAADNGFGVTGIAHEAQGYFFPTLSVEEGSRLPNAILSASQLFEEGDVLNFSIGFPGAGPIIVSPAIAGLIRLCSDLGITCVMSAGNDAIPIEPAPFETDAIVVGACFPGGNLVPFGCTQLGIFHYCRLNFSNFSAENSEGGLAEVHVASWGTGVATTGYGVLFRGANGTDPNDLETNNLRKYTSAFNGTSAAGPIIAGLVACLQGMAKQLYDAPISPSQMRGVLQGNTVGDQCWPLNPITLGPGPDDPVCNEDLFKRIGQFPDALQCGFAIMNGQFVSGNPTQIKVIWGTPANAVNSFRIRALDGNVLKVNTQQANAGSQVEGLVYLATGPTTDIYAQVETFVTPIGLNSLSLNVFVSATKPFVVIGGFLWNRVDNRWDFIGVNFTGPGGGGGAFAVPALTAEKYLQPYGGQSLIQARLWTCGLGAVGPHQVWYDLIEIAVNAPVIPAP